MTLHHRQILSLIQSILDDWDPLELLVAGAPADEHADEAARLLARLPTMLSKKATASAVAEVFAEAFDDPAFTPVRCADVGARLYERLQEAGLSLPTLAADRIPPCPAGDGGSG